MRLIRLLLTDYRNYESAEFEPAPTLTVLTGRNGAGKTNLLEAVGYVASLSSFRNAPSEALVRQGCERAFLRAEVEQRAPDVPEVEHREGRSLLCEVELSTIRPARALINRQPLRRDRDISNVLRVVVFAPDDLSLIKGGPAERRRFVDDILVSLHPRNRSLRSDLDRILRQRNALLSQIASSKVGRRRQGPHDDDAMATLEVWDERLAQVGDALGSARSELIARLEPLLGKAYSHVAVGKEGGAGKESSDRMNAAADVMVTYLAPWREEGLAAALRAVRSEELRRGVSVVGPHRDEVVFTLGVRPSRTHASQGEQRSLALALRMASHELITEATGSSPVLLLDDVFSELDAERSEALLACLPPAQTLLSTTGPVPSGSRPGCVIHVRDGCLSVVGP